MFSKLEKKVTFMIVLTLLICLFLVSVISYTTIRKKIYDSFWDLSLQHINIQKENIHLWMKYIEEIARQISVDPDIIDNLSEVSKNIDMIPKLDTICSLDSKILGIIMYSINGNNYSSSGVSGYPSMIIQNPSLIEFIKSDKQSQWVLRSEEKIFYYNYMNYDATKSIITYITKLYDSKSQLCGYMLLDTSIDSFYYFFSSGENSLNYANIFITSDDGFVAEPRYAQIESHLLDDIKRTFEVNSAYVISSDKKFGLVINRLTNSNMKVIVAIPLNRLYTSLNLLIIIMIILFAILTVVSFVLGSVLAKSISRPLNALLQKMRENMPEE
ncbi:MAG TPA: hypothetical protein GXX14_12145 [Clostridiaceae bacterium]|nr:hypothetical protein [Clostridiaceae bacterium]